MAKKCFVILGLIMICLFPASNVFAEVGEAHEWTHGDWSSRVLWEAKYALSQAADGYSSNTTGSGIYKKWYGDWDYVNSDATARDNAKIEGYDIMGPVGADGYGHYRGGECTYFVRLILYRATYWAFNDHYAMHNYPDSVYSETDNLESDPSNFQPGWMLLTPSNTHYAIAEKRETIDGVSGWWVIDSNWVGWPDYTYVIGKHFMSDSLLINHGYYGTPPVLGTYN